MIKSELISQIRQKTGLSKKEIQYFLRSFTFVITDALANGEDVRIRNFGRFTVKEQKERKYYNFRTNKVEVAPKKKKPVCIFAPFSKKVHVITPQIVRIDNTGKCVSVFVKSQPRNSQSINSYQTLGGNMIIPNLAVGNRKEMGIATETLEFKYWGKVINGLDRRDSLSKENYPFCLIPQKDTPILACTSFVGTVNGVSEPKLFNKLGQLRKIEKEIELLKEVSLPIRNRNYGYKPDIAIVWKSKGICIDVEIDEPYDILSRKPIHYTDEDCGDYLRNAYFLENGWYVIRVSEEQVINHLDKVYNFVSQFIYAISQDERFKSIIDIKPVKRWTREEAKLMAERNSRENYLGLPPVESPIMPEDEDYNIPDSFEFKRPQTDIIDCLYGDLHDRLRDLAEKSNYLRIKSTENGYEYIVTKERIEYFFHGIRLFDVVEEKEFYLSYANIDSFIGLDDIRIEKQDDKDWGSFIYDSVVHCRPIHFIYRKGYGGVSTERTVIHLVPFVKYGTGPEKYLETHTVIEWLDDVPHGMYKRICNIKSLTKFTGYCCYRKDVRTFDPYNIVEGYAYNCYKPRVKYGTKDVLEVLEKGDGRLAEIIYSHFTEEEKNNYANIANNGHALVIQGKYVEALTFYSSIPKEKVIYDNVTWHQALCEDIETFCRNETYGAKFDYVKKLLCDNEEEENIHNG